MDTNHTGDGWHERLLRYVIVGATLEDGRNDDDDEIPSAHDVVSTRVLNGKDEDHTPGHMEEESENVPQSEVEARDSLRPATEKRPEAVTTRRLEISCLSKHAVILRASTVSRRR